MKVNLKAVVISDTHVDMRNLGYILTTHNLKKAFKIMQKENKYDALAIVGDTTSRGGEERNWKKASECFKIRPAKELVIAVGNHDTWGGEYTSCAEIYRRYVGVISGEKPEKMWFSRVINGYRFICLGSEDDVGCAAVISDEQVEWLDNELNLADGNPAFVFCHQSLNGKHGLPKTWSREEDPERDPMEGGIGVDSDKVENTLKKYKNVFYFSGHSHMGLCGDKYLSENGWSTFEEDDGVHLINMPCFSCKNHHGEREEPGIGVRIEVTDDNVYLNPVNYLKKTELTDFNKVYDIVK